MRALCPQTNNKTKVESRIVFIYIFYTNVQTKTARGRKGRVSRAVLQEEEKLPEKKGKIEEDRQRNERDRRVFCYWESVY